MKCPYTAMQAFFKNAVDFIRPVAPAGDSPPQPVQDEGNFPPKGLAAAEMLYVVNLRVKEVNTHAASTQCGNLPLQLKPGWPDADVRELVKTETHGVLRETVGDLGKTLDHSALDEKTGAAMAALKQDMSAYRKHGEAIRDLHKAHYGTPDKPKGETCPEYKNLDGLKAILDASELAENDTYVTASQAMALLEKDSAAHLQAITANLNKAAKIPLTGGRLVPNKEVKTNVSLGLWLFCAEEGAKALSDTTKAPACLYEKISTTLGMGDTIMKHIVSHVCNTPSAQAPELMDVFEKNAVKLQNSYTACGSFQQLQENAADFIQAAGIHTQEDYDAAKLRAAQAEHKRPADYKPYQRPLRKGGGCPHFQSKQKPF